MANETNNDLSATFSTFLSAGSTLLQQSVDILSSGIKSTVHAVEPLGKTAIDLIGIGTNTVGKVIESVSSTIAPKK